MKKRLLSLLLAVLMAVLLLPAEALAITGGEVQRMYMNAAPATVKKEGVDDGSQIYSLKMNNGKLVMFIATSGPHMGKSVTNSDRGYTATGDSFRLGVYEQARFTLQTRREQKPLTIRSMEVVDPTREPQLSGVSMDMAPMENALTVKYTFDGEGLSPAFLCYISYYFVELSAGVTDGTITDIVQDADGRTYALAAQASWGLGLVTETTMPPEFQFRWYQDYHGFSRMGHAKADAAAHVKLSRTYGALDGEITAKSTDITAGMGRAYVFKPFGKGDIAEIYSDSYGVDNPFVLADVDRLRHANDIWTPVYMTYDAAADTLTAEGYTGTVGGRSGRGAMNAMHIWGFRDVYTKKEAADTSKVEFTKPDQVTIPQDANKLGLYKTERGLTAAPITDAAREAALQKRYGDPLYILRGNFETLYDKDGRYYEYTECKAALTATITAVWGSEDHFRVRVDGNGLVTAFDTTTKVRYTTPRFQLYSPANDAAEPAKLVFEDGCLTLRMDPYKNAVLVFIDIPQVKSLIDRAQIKPNGNLVLTGEMGLDLILNCTQDQLIELEALGYAPKKEQDDTISFVQEGFKANGKIDTAALMGLDLAELEASINTFDGEEDYDFSLELNAFDLFETQAELQLKRLNNGRLAPNKLYFALAAQPGIPLVPPVPTAFLRGGGGGFDGLADTINGDYIAIPPILLRLTAIGDYLKVIKGKLDVTLGPSYLAYGGRDIEIAGADVLDSFSMYLRLQGEKRSYLNKEYTGLRAGGGMSVTIKAPQEDFFTGTVFEVEGKAEASVFGGLDNYSRPTSAHLQLDSRGGVTGKVMFPKKLGPLTFPHLGGKTLAEASVDFILGAQTAVTVDPRSYAGKSVDEILATAAQSAWNNLSVYGGLSTSGKLGVFYYRLYYVIPDHVGGKVALRNINKNWTLEQEIDKNAWFVGGAQTISGGPGWATQVGKCYDPETGEQVGIAVLEVSTYWVDEDSMPVTLANPQNGGFTTNLTYDPAASSAEPDSELGLLLTVKNGGSVEELRRSAAITYTVGSDATVHTLTLEDMDKGAQTINEDGNCVEVEENGVPGLMVFTGLAGNETYRWTITADCDFEGSIIASAPLTALDFQLSANGAESTVLRPQSGRQYAVRYYFDTVPERTGDHYFLEMRELAVNQTADTFPVPAGGSLAPSGSYHVTAVLVEKVTGDFNGDGTISEDEYSWVTVDTQTSGGTVAYVNTMQPDAPADVALTATGNETLTAGWQAVDGADGYRVTLYYRENNSWRQAGAPYVLDNADFDDGSDIAAASKTGGRRTLRMAPTVGDAGSVAPANASYKVTVEAFRRDTELASALYYSAAAEPAGGTVYLPRYDAPEITVTTGSGQAVTLNAASGYDSLLWNELPGGVLFSAEGSVDGITVTPEQGSGRFDVSGGNGHWEVSAGDADAAALIESGGRVLLTVTSGQDTTEYYLRLLLDDVPPVIALDAANIRANMTTGAYTVTGQTEPGLTVTMENGNGAVLATTADLQGRFTFKGTLPVSMEEGFDANGDPATVKNGFRALVTDVTAQDEAGNTGIAPVLISARPESRNSDPDDGGSGGSGGVTGGTSSPTGDPGVVLYAAAALLSLTGSVVLTGRRKRR